MLKEITFLETQWTKEEENSRRRFELKSHQETIERLYNSNTFIIKSVAGDSEEPTLYIYCQVGEFTNYFLIGDGEIIICREDLRDFLEEVYDYTYGFDIEKHARTNMTLGFEPIKD